MTKSEVILKAISEGATDEQLMILESTPDSQFELNTASANEPSTIVEDVANIAIKDPEKEEQNIIEEQEENIIKEQEEQDKETDDRLYLGEALSEINVKSEKIENFNPFGFLNFGNAEEFSKNTRSFFGQDKDIAQVQLQKILGPSYKIEKDRRIKNANMINITHEDSGKSIKIDFGVDSLSSAEWIKKNITRKSTRKLVDYVNQTMSKEDLSGIQAQQGEILKKYNELNAAPILNEKGELVKEAGPLYISKEDKDNINDKFDKENIFLPYDSTTTSKREGFSTTVKVQPHEEELNEAKEALIDSGVKEPTKKQIEDRARYILKQNAINDIRDQKATDYFNSDAVEETELDALLKLGGLLSKRINFNTKKIIAENEVKLKDRIDNIEKDELNKNSDIALANEFIKISNSSTPTIYDESKFEKERITKENEIKSLNNFLEENKDSMFASTQLYELRIKEVNQKIKEYNSFLEENKDKRTVVLQNGTKMPKSVYDKYIVAVNSTQQKYNEIFELQDKLAIDISKIEDEEVKYDLVRRNYNDGEKFVAKIGVGFLDILSKAAYGANKLQSGLLGIDNKHVDDEFLKVKKAIEIYYDSFQKDIKFENAFNRKNYGRFLLQEFQNQAPIFALIATGKVGIATLGLSSAADNWSRIVEEDASKPGKDTSLFKKIVTSAAFGTAEFVFDYYLTRGVMQRSWKALYGNAKNFRRMTRPGMLKYAKENAKNQLIYEPFTEVVAETATTFSQNIISGENPLNNLAHSAFSGGFWGFGFGGTPFIKGLVMQNFSDYNSYNNFRLNLSKVTNLRITEKKLNSSLKANKTKGNDTSAIESNIETVKEEIKSLQNENESIIKSVEKKTNNLSKRWFDTYVAATNEQEQIRIDVDNIMKDVSLSNTEKQSLLNIKKLKFDALQNTRDVLRDDKNFGNAYAAFRNSNKKEDQDRLEEIQGQATSELINEGTLEPKDDAIDTRSRIIFNTQEINKDYNSKKSMLDGANFQNFQTIEQAIEFVGKMDLADNAKQNIISNIERGAHGVNIIDKTQAITPIQVVENMAKGDRLETRTHELGHTVFAAAFGNNKEAFDDIAESVLEFVKQKNKNLHIKMLNQVERGRDGKMISEEVLTNFLEMVAEGKIDNKSEKNKGIIPFFANALNIGAKKSLGEKADFNFKGETDAVNFLVNLGKKIKAGTLTIKDIQDIRDTGIAQKVKTKPETKFSKEASDKVQAIYDEKGEAGAMEIIEQFKPITNKLVQKRSEAPNFDRQLLTDEIETGKRGIFDLIRKYDPSKGVPLAAYINDNLPKRAIEASKRVLGEEFTQDVTERVDIAAEEVTTEVTKKRKPKKIVLADRLGVKDKVSKAIKEKLPKLDIQNLNFKTLKDQTPEITGELFGILPKKLISGANITKGELQSAQMFINKNADLLITMLPEGTTAGGTATGIPKTLLNEFYVKGDRAKMAKTGTKAGLAVQIKKENINKKDFLEVFGIIDGKPDRTDRNTSARVLALANLTGKMMTNQAVREQLIQQNTPLITKHIARISDGKSSIMFSKDNSNNTKQQPILKDVFGGINSLLSKEQQVLFDDNILQFVSTYVGVNEAKMTDAQKNEILLTEDIDSIKIALRVTYGNNMSQTTLDAIAMEIVNTVSKLNISKKSKNVVKQEKIIEAIINAKEQASKKIAKYTGSNTTAAIAQDDLVRQENRRKSDAVWFDNNFQKNKEQAIADLIMLGGHSHTSGKIGGGRGQYYKNVKDYYDYHLGNVNVIPVYKTFKRDNKLVYELDTKATAKKNGLKYSTIIDGKKVTIEDIPVTKASQTSASAIKDHKNPKSLKERRKHEKHARRVLNEYVAHNVDRYKTGKQDNVDIMLMMNSLLSNMNSVLARAAKLEYIELGVNAKDARYEHMQPRVAVLIRIVDAHINRGGIENIDTFLNNYDIAIINKKFDKAITDAGYQYTLADGQSFDDSSLIRYYNDKTLTDKRLELVVEIGTNKIPKLVDSFVKTNKLLKPKLKELKRITKAINEGRMMYSKPSRGITVLDFDDTLATSKSQVISTAPDGTVRKLTAEEFAKEGADLLDQGWTHDFSEFSKVVGGKVASLFNKALKLQKKFGPENMFVLTARPADSAPAIFQFLKANGLNIPLKNITGLANSTPEAKALWIADKVAEGYNDFYFADDALQNVQAVDNMLSQFDVKSKVQQAKIKFSKPENLNKEFNGIIEATTGIESQKQFSDQQARLRGAKTKYKSIIPASAQDFQGLLYSFLGKGKKGEADMAFFKKALIDPFARGINELNARKQTAANDFKNLNKEFKDVKKKFYKKIKDSEYTHDQAIRVYLWNKAGFEIPGLSKRDLKILDSAVKKDSRLQAYADAIGLISKKDNGYNAPKNYWLAENIASDLLSDGGIGDVRSEHLAEWIENKNVIFSPENLNKIQAIYGSKFRESLEDMLYRMENGRNRPTGSSRLVNSYLNWVNNSVGAIMFLNLRSATLQTISAVNYINWNDNNPLKAGAAFANQKQFWSDFVYIFNSDFLKQRRSGNQRGVNEAEISEAVAGSDNKAKAAIAWLLKKGFTPTQIADSFAISMGGASFYRNRIKTYVKDGMSQKDAEAKAWLDFQEITEVNQQSARPDMISQQQASPLGRLILAFQNTPMQYARIMNKATRDLYNGRGDAKTHVSKIVYYGVAQSIIFGALQSALYASLGDDEEEQFDKKKERILNQMVDSWLTGIGVGGKAIGTMKNSIMEYLKQRDRGFRADHAYTILTLLSFSPPIGSKLRKIYSSIKQEQWNRGVFQKRGFTLDNPIWSAVGGVVEGITNIPMARMSNLMLQMDNAMDSNHKWWQRVALVLGQNTWDLGIQDPDIEAIKIEIKAEKRKASKERAKIKKEEKKKEKEEKEKAIIEENKKKSEKDGICSAVSKSGKRCKNKAVKDGFCTIHEKTEQRKDGKQIQCKKIKNNGDRCKMQTSNKSGYCYYHD